MSEAWARIVVDVKLDDSYRTPDDVVVTVASFTRAELGLEIRKVRAELLDDGPAPPDPIVPNQDRLVTQAIAALERQDAGDDHWSSVCSKGDHCNDVELLALAAGAARLDQGMDRYTPDWQKKLVLNKLLIIGQVASSRIGALIHAFELAEGTAYAEADVDKAQMERFKSLVQMIKSEIGWFKQDREAREAVG